jgi:hypothetical protein
MHTADVLRPRAVDCTVDHDVSDMLCPQLLRLGQETQNASVIPSMKSCIGSTVEGDNPVDILLRVEPDLGGYQGQK